jgi:hypothetical protein
VKYLTSGILAIGCFLGISAVLVFEVLTDFFGASLDVPTEFVATILGAAIALSGTLFTLAVSKEDKERERQISSEELICSIYIKTLRIVNNLLALQKHINRSVEEARQNKREVSSVLRGFSSVTDPVVFSESEKIAVLLKKHTELINFLSDLDTVHNGLTRDFEEYGRQRECVSPPNPIEVAGTTASFKIPKDREVEFSIEVAKLNDLAMQLHASVNKNTIYAQEALQAVSKELHMETGMEIRLSDEDRIKS